MSFWTDPGQSLGQAVSDAKNGGVNISNALELGGDVAGAIYGGPVGIANLANYTGNQISRATGGTGSVVQDLGGSSQLGQGVNTALGLGTAYESIAPTSWGGASAPTWAGGSDSPTWYSGGEAATTPQTPEAEANLAKYMPGYNPNGAGTAQDIANTQALNAGATQSVNPGYTPNAPSTPGVAPGSAPSAGMSTAQKIALGLGATNSLYSLSQAGKQTSMQDQQQQAALTQQQQAQNLVNQALSGQLNPGDQARLAQSRQDSINAKKAYYAQAGLSDSSMAQQDIASINAQYDQAAYAITQSMLTQGLQATGIANGAVQQAVTAQIQSDAKLQAAQQQFFAMLMQYGLKG